MNKLAPAHVGEMYILSLTLLSGLFPIFTILSVSSVPPLYSAALSTIIAAITFTFILTIKKKWHELTNRKAWKDMILTSLIIGGVFYSLVFIGIQRTTAGNASIILLMQILFSMIILRIFKKENLSSSHIIGSILMGIGAIIVLFRGQFNVNEGDIILLLASIIPPLGNYFAQHARKIVSSTTIMFVRSVLAGIFILILALIFEPAPTTADLTSSALFIFINGFLILGFTKIIWIEAIHLIPITKAIALSAFSPMFTLIFAYFILSEIPSVWQILGFIPMFIGIILLTIYLS